MYDPGQESELQSYDRDLTTLTINPHASTDHPTHTGVDTHGYKHILSHKAAYTRKELVSTEKKTNKSILLLFIPFYISDTFLNTSSKYY